MSGYLGDLVSNMEGDCLTILSEHHKYGAINYGINYTNKK